MQVPGYVSLWGGFILLSVMFMIGSAVFARRMRRTYDQGTVPNPSTPWANPAGPDDDRFSHG